MKPSDKLLPRARAPQSHYQTPPATQPSSSAPANYQSVYSWSFNAPTPSQTNSQAERNAWLAPVDDDDGDVDEIVSSTQNAADNDDLHLYGDLPTKIVGVRYYSGIANRGEYILMRRELGNPYDSSGMPTITWTSESKN
jgi:SWI/SNF-related matrix-associated actin-dependent regulator of chromatin subfamily A3